MPKLISVQPQPDYKLYLQYDDGVTGEVDLSNLVGRGVFAVWCDSSVFEAVNIGDHGEVRWSDELELCADAIYLQITGKSAEYLFPNLKASADA